MLPFDVYSTIYVKGEKIKVLPDKNERGGSDGNNVGGQGKHILLPVLI